MNNRDYSYFAFRVVLGLLLLAAGLYKLSDPSRPMGMLTSLGFPAPAVFAWILLLSEIIFGLSVLIGWKVKYTTWPLVVVLAVAVIMVVIPNQQQLVSSNLLFHLLAITGLIHVALDGPGIWAVSRE